MPVYIAVLDLSERKRPGVSQSRLNRPHWMKKPVIPDLFQPVGPFFLTFFGGREMTQNLKLRIKLYEKGITQTALSKKTKIPRGYINGAVTGRVHLSPVEKKEIADVLRCKISEIF